MKNCNAGATPDSLINEIEVLILQNDKWKNVFDGSMTQIDYDTVINLPD
jgi:hypothetical protein